VAITDNMTKPSFPGFSAQFSLRQTSTYYKLGPQLHSVTNRMGLYPQQSWLDCAACAGKVAGCGTGCWSLSGAEYRSCVGSCLLNQGLGNCISCIS
jgi:hypothetical protein